MDRRTFLRRSAVALAAAPFAAPALAAGHGRLGAFQGASNHVTTGTAEMAGRQVNLLADFSFDGAPDPKVALGHDGYDARTLMGPLQSDSGAQSYTIPDGIDPAQYNEVWIWCERFDVPLGVARLGG